jgi:hypothetical protein
VANSVGIEDAGSDNTLGGSVLGARNIISGNSTDGILLDSTAQGDTVQSNFLGLTVKGSAALANGTNGIEVQGTNNTIGGNSGSNYYTRNYLSGNSTDGLLFDSGGSGNVVLGNFIGLDISGTHALGNVANGIEIAGSHNTIGGTTSGVENVISGNVTDGILLDSSATSNLVQRNQVGTDYTGKGAVGNVANGISILGNNNTIGGGGAAGNTIANNGGDGVLVSIGTGNNIQSNPIFANTGLGIDLASGGNNNIVAPSLISASYSGGTLTVSGTYTAAVANVGYLIQIFASPSSGSNEGAVYLGSILVHSSTTGTNSFNFTLTTSAVQSDPVITATITDSSGDTSEFSNSVTS